MPMLFVLLFFFHKLTAPVGLVILIVETSKSHSDTPHLVWLLWTNDRHVAETSTWQHTTLTRDRYPCTGREINPQSRKRATAVLRLRPPGHRPMDSAIIIIIVIII